MSRVPHWISLPSPPPLLVVPQSDVVCHIQVQRAPHSCHRCWSDSFKYICEEVQHTLERLSYEGSYFKQSPTRTSQDNLCKSKDDPLYDLPTKMTIQQRSNADNGPTKFQQRFVSISSNLIQLPFGVTNQQACKILTKCCFQKITICSALWHPIHVKNTYVYTWKKEAWTMNWETVICTFTPKVLASLN